MVTVGFVDKVFMNDSQYANEEAFLSAGALVETLMNWLPLSSSKNPVDEHIHWIHF